MDSLTVPAGYNGVSATRVFFIVPAGQQFVLTDISYFASSIADVTLWDNGTTWRWTFGVNPGGRTWGTGLVFDAGHSVSLRAWDEHPNVPALARFSWSGFLVPIGTTAISPDTQGQLGFRVAPNPARHVVSLRFELARPAEVDLAVYDVQGRRIRGLRKGALGAGSHEVAWDGRDDAGQSAAAGTYFARISSSEARSVKKLVRIQ